MHLARFPKNNISLVYLLFTVLTYFLRLTSASPIPYSDEKLADIDRLRASGASEVFSHRIILNGLSLLFSCSSYPDNLFLPLRDKIVIL